MHSHVTGQVLQSEALALRHRRVGEVGIEWDEMPVRSLSLERHAQWLFDHPLERGEKFRAQLATDDALIG